MIGDDCPGSSKRPERPMQAGATQLIAPKGLNVGMERVGRGEPFRDGGSRFVIVGTRCPIPCARQTASEDSLAHRYSVSIPGRKSILFKNGNGFRAMHAGSEGRPEECVRTRSQRLHTAESREHVPGREWHSRVQATAPRKLRYSRFRASPW